MTSRIESIDILRGLVIVLMALDHSRDFFSGSGLDPRNVHDSMLFMTRWVTHLCAPTFIFLAGVSIYLWQHRHTKKETSRIILFRGLWLILLEFTVVRAGWTFNINPRFMDAQVIWVIGVSMVFMSIAIYLPFRLLALLSGIMIIGHNAFDTISAENLGAYRWLWVVLHEQAMLTPWNNMQLYVSYPLIPWPAVMSLGYCFGGYFLQPKSSRIRYYLIFWITSIALFTALRFSNYYGDPMPWIDQGTTVTKILSFINCEKYPPSLLYLLMTLGLASLLLVFMENSQGKLSRLLLVFGRVPLLFYMIHVAVIHLFAVIVATVKGENQDWLLNEPYFSKPADYGYNLGIVYLVWIVVIACLYPICINYWQLKQKHNALFRYL
jgi:uncharacterized membrane protein